MANNKLYILWTNADPITFEHMVFMYGFNSMKYKWWSEVTLIIWGATTKLVSEDLNIQSKVKEMLQEGVKISACKACADALGVTNKIEDLGIELKLWGPPFTKILNSDEKLITI